jgi:hypothetical protein
MTVVSWIGMQGNRHLFHWFIQLIQNEEEFPLMLVVVLLA